MNLPKLFAGLALAALHCLCGAQPLPQKFDPQRDAAADLRVATQLAQTQGKRVIVDVGGNWCAPCLVLDRFVAEDAEVRAALAQGFVWLKLNWSPDNRNEKVLAQWPKIKSYPQLFVLDAQGRLLLAQSGGELMQKSQDAFDRVKFLAFLKSAGA